MSSSFGPPTSYKETAELSEQIALRILRAQPPAFLVTLIKTGHRMPDKKARNVHMRRAQLVMREYDNDTWISSCKENMHRTLMDVLLENTICGIPKETFFGVDEQEVRFRPT